MTDEARPWYETLFERDWYDYFAKGGPGSPDTDGSYARRTDSEVEFIVQALGLTEACDLLDLCCGPGRHSVRLATLGHRVTGVDISAYNLEKAVERAAEFGVEVDWREGDMRETGLPESSQDAAINMFTAFGFFDDAENQRVLEEVARVLRPGGCFLIDLVNRDSLMRRHQARMWSERHNGAFLFQEHAFDSATGCQTTNWTVVKANGERIEQSFTLRAYTLQELEIRMALAGLTVEDAWGGLDGAELTMDSHRLVIRARAE
ncbi:MAG: methyltransferase domain-containing protein [Dehalococcoidia bacterium]|nr:methyltransferase domain-containing protein [Dehalococcoidia bacterium]